MTFYNPTPQQAKKLIEVATDSRLEKCLWLEILENGTSFEGRTEEDLRCPRCEKNNYKATCKYYMPFVEKVYKPLPRTVVEL